MTTYCTTMPRRKNSGAVTAIDRYGSMPPSAKSQYEEYIASIIIAPWAKLTMRSTPKIRVSPLATRPYTPPRRLSLPLGHREDRLCLGVLRGPDDGRLAALDLDQGRRGVDILAALVELDRLLGQDVFGEVRLRDRVPHLFAV